MGFCRPLEVAHFGQDLKRWITPLELATRSIAWFLEHHLTVVLCTTYKEHPCLSKMPQSMYDFGVIFPKWCNACKVLPLCNENTHYCQSTRCVTSQRDGSNLDVAFP